MNTCKTCKWHTPSLHGDPAQNTNGGWCECPKLYEGDLAPDGEVSHGRDHLVYPYIESAGFWTGHDFGCLHWAEEEPPYMTY